MFQDGRQLSVTTAIDPKNARSSSSQEMENVQVGLGTMRCRLKSQKVVTVAILLTIIREKACKVFSTFSD